VTGFTVRFRDVIFGTVKKLLPGLLVIAGVVHGFSAEIVPDFQLSDANAKSARLGGIVSPRDYSLQIAGYYFGEAH
jgi:hypothetical protein